MKLELRASAGPVCDQCGATELIHTAATHEAFVTDLTQQLSFYGARDLADTEAIVMAKTDQALAEINEDAKKRILELRAEIKAMYEAEIRDLHENLDRYLCEDKSKFRLIQKRHIERLRAELKSQVEQMLTRTHLA